MTDSIYTLFNKRLNLQKEIEYVWAPYEQTTERLVIGYLTDTRPGFDIEQHMGKADLRVSDLKPFEDWFKSRIPCKRLFINHDYGGEYRMNVFLLHILLSEDDVMLYKLNGGLNQISGCESLQENIVITSIL